MSTQHQPTSQPQKIITIKRTFNLPIAKVWKAWSEVESFQKWWGPKDYTCPHCTINFEKGGHYLACMKAPDGKETWSTGNYKEIEPLKKIVLTDSFCDSMGNKIHASAIGMPGEWPLELLITVEMEERKGKTDFTLIYRGVPNELQEDCIIGWQESFDKLEKQLK